MGETADDMPKALLLVGMQQLPSIVWAYEDSFPAGLSLRTGPPALHRLWQIRAGAARFRGFGGGGDSTVGPGQWVWVPVNAGNQWLEAGTRLRSIALLATGPASTCLPAEAHPQILAAPPKSLDRAVGSFLKRIRRLRAPGTARTTLKTRAAPPADMAWFEAERARCLAAVLEAVSPLTQNATLTPSAPPPLLVPVLAAMSAALPGPLPDPAKLAERTGRSWRRIEQLFMAWRGQSPRQYYARLRVEEAYRQLADPDSPIKRVAYDLGFSHASQFTQWFRRMTGQPPSAYRDALRGGV